MAPDTHPTIKDVALLARSIPSAVSFVVNGKAQGRVSEPVRRRILKAIRALDYRRHDAAAGLRLNRTFKATICVPAHFRRAPLLGNLSHHELVNRLAHRLHESGLGVVLVEVDRMDRAAVERIRGEPVDGYLCVQFQHAALEQLTHVLNDLQRPVVAVDSPMEGGLDLPWHFGIDRERSFQLATEHMIRRGLRRITMLDVSIPGVLTPIKRRGYERAMHEAGLEPLPLFSMTREDVRGLREAIDEMLNVCGDVEGVVLTDNYLAPMVQQMLAQRAVTLVGFGDAGPARLCDPPLAYLQLPLAELAETAVEALLGRIDNADKPTGHGALLCRLVPERR